MKWACLNPIASLLPVGPLRGNNLQQIETVKALPDPTLLVDPDKDLDFETINRHGFRAPSELDLNNDEVVDKIIDEINNTNRYTLGKEKRKVKTAEERDAIKHDQDVLSKYRGSLRTLRKNHELVVEPILHIKSGTGLKMMGSQFGTLFVDPIALLAGKLQAYNGGNLVLEAPADASLHNLLTKRFVKTKQYSPVATFKKLVELAGLPIHGRKSKNHRLIKQGGAVQYYNDPEQLVERLQLLVASKQAGNMGVGNEISAILDELMRDGAIPKGLVIQLNKSLCKF